MITPGGNPTCAVCKRWYGPGMKHVCDIEGASALDVEDFQMLAAALQRLDDLASDCGAFVSGELHLKDLDFYVDVEWDNEKSIHVVKYVNIL